MADKQKGRTGRNKGRIRNRCPSHARAVAGHWTEQHKYVRIFRSQGKVAAVEYETACLKRGIYIPQNAINRETARWAGRKDRKILRSA